jgi:hypothetical protein
MCTGCVDASEVGFSFAGSTTKGGKANDAEALDGLNSTAFIRTTGGSIDGSLTATSPGIALVGISGGTTGSAAGVLGMASRPDGFARGVMGRSDSPDGAGVVATVSGSRAAAMIADSTATSGNPVGIKASVASNGGVAGRFIHRGAGGFIIEAYAADNRRFAVNHAGDVFADASFNCGNSATPCFVANSGADIAERIDVSVSEQLEAGDVVEIDPDANGSFRRSRAANSQLVVGVISTSPAITMANADDTDGEPDGEPDGRPLLALAGRVPVKVVDEGGPIRPGDLLTSSSTAGFAMRCSITAACTGAVIGKALGRLEMGRGRIEVFLNLH